MHANNVPLKAEEKCATNYSSGNYKECRNIKPLKTHNTAKIRFTVNVHSPQQLQRHLQQHQACRASTLTLAPSKRCSIPQRQCNQPSIDVLIEIRQACLGHNVVPSISGARPSGRRQRVHSDAEQIESHNCNRHGLLCSCQHQSLHSVGGRYNIRLFKLSRLMRRRNFAIFPLHPRRAQDSQINSFNCCCGCWVFAFQ